jgi:hypothetical protein
LPPFGAAYFFLGFELRLLLGKPAAIALGIGPALHAVFIGARQFLRKARDLRIGGKPDIGFHWFQHAECSPVVIGNSRIRGTNSQPIQGI